MDAKTFEKLKQLIESSELIAKRKALFSGKKINSSEDRAVLHTALRQEAWQAKANNQPHGNAKKKSDLQTPTEYRAPENIRTEIYRQANKMMEFARSFQNGEIRGCKNKGITHLVNIGIGGSYLGTQLVYNALMPSKLTHLGSSKSKKSQSPLPQLKFISNVDSSNLFDTLDEIPLEQTLFFVASKTFTTEETMSNANSIKKILIKKLGKDSVRSHFVAISSNDEAAVKFGIKKDWVFRFGDYVGGRYSIWSSIGLPLVLALGTKTYQKLLEGANWMDMHFHPSSSVGKSTDSLGIATCLLE